jgi:hypothetical protein
VKPPRRVLIYVDANERGPFLAQWKDLDAKVQAKVRSKQELLAKGEWDGLLSKEIVKHLKGNVFELRVKGSGMFAVRVFFFMETCRGCSECILTEIHARAALNKLGKFTKYIVRAEAMRLDWKRRHCKGTR